MMASVSKSPVLPKWQSITLPLIAGLLHLQVFYYAAVHCLLRVGSSNDITSDEFRNECFLLDRAIFLAYVFDLLCCWFKVIPFSRCNCSRDIIGHHIPTLVMALPLAIPLLWSDYWPTLRQFESTSFSILDGNTAFSANNEQLRTHFINSYTLASGFAYISSLNEVFMCFQRVEMSLQGVTSFRDIPHMKTHIFTSKLAVFVELTYKLCFFWGISLFACKACCDFDKSLYDSLIAQQQQIVGTDYVSTWRTLVTVYSSPAVLRGALFRAFSIVMYPSMGLRCYKKIKHLHRDLDGNGVKDVKSA